MVLASLLAAAALGGSPSASLTVTVWPQGRDHVSKTRTLNCNPAGGTLPGRAAACRRLAAFPDSPFAPIPPDTVCSQIYGGPQAALVRGSFRGRGVWATFSRRDGCAISRWDRLAFLFGVRL